MNVIINLFSNRYICWLTAVITREAKPKRVAVDEAAVKINGEWSWLYAAIDTETKLILDVELFGRHGTDPAAALSIDSRRNTISQTLCFLLMATAIRLPSLG
ncbi:hypothetical protein C499_14090 [Halogeometricum borinquense DSM 11551]|uniref:DDE domain-containing protein n=1 Tax=Halogeometricum borinquense (strain ATCC 700274 / DSM 11551 / JCM 10706 / KCTC 4070 / PR3) TaxID=469382 RepID=E4NTZ0_HALBP|nr:hypothetical protein Hbor_29710 [Halogeometricum borinquense DSM 11551]ELY25619.1 hypothetical protein C499_14090 [Halogeometricum borinquense DSM 11551]